MEKSTSKKVLYKHQEEFLLRNKDRDLLVWETGTGKSLAACEWIKKRSKNKTLIVCPKAIVGKWKRDLELEDIVADVCTRDEVKKIDLNKYGNLVIDEAQDFSAPLFDKARSQRSTVIYNYARNNPKANILLLTATPIRSRPENIHTLACYLGIYWPIKQFRDEFFHMTDRFGRLHYEPNKDWRKKIRPYLEKISNIVLMSDCVDVPIQTEKIIDIKWTEDQEKELKKQYLEPSAEWHMRHRLEQGNKKLSKLKEILDGYRKSIVVCHYRSQIEEYAKEIGKDRQVFVLHGTVKDQDKVIEEAKASDDAVFIIQSSMGSGFDASEFSVIIFASLDFKYISMVQMKGRVKRINNLHKNTFIYLLGGKNDHAVYKTIMAGKDFDPIVYMDNKDYEKNKSEDKEFDKPPF